MQLLYSTAAVEWTVYSINYSYPARTYIKQLCGDTGCSPEDLPEAMNDGKSGERGSGISMLVARHDDDDMVLNIPI